MKKGFIRKQTMAIVLAALMAGGALAGCSSGSKEATAVATETTTAGTQTTSEKEGQVPSGDIKPCTIKFRYWADNTDYSQLMQDIIKKFNDENGKGITVVGEESPWDGGAYSENLFNAKMGGGDIDCATWKLTSTPLFVNNDLLADLTPKINAWDKKADIDDNIYDIMKEAGDMERIYVMPWNIQVLYVYYRPSIFKKAGKVGS